MFTLSQVIEGLSGGVTYHRELDSDRGYETLTPLGNGDFRHDVRGGANGGWGGSANLPIATLCNGRWPNDKWRRA